jgi:hypothetical protein
LLEPTRPWIPPGCRRGQPEVSCQPVLQLVENAVDLLVAAELSHVNIADLCHGLDTRKRWHHDGIGRFLQGPGGAELEEANRPGEEGGRDQLDHQAGLLQLTAQVSAHVSTGWDAGGPR